MIKAKLNLPQQQIKLLVSNVYEHNENHDGCLEMIKNADPDIILLLETNQR